MKKRIKALFVCSSTNIGGAEKNILLINNLLSKNKYLDNKIVFLRKTNEKKINFNKRNDFIFLNSSKIFFSLFKLLNYVKKNKPNIIFSTTYSVNLVCIIVKMLSFNKFFLITRESNNIFQKKIYSNFYEKLLLKFVFLYNFADQVIAPSITIFKQLNKIILKKKKILLINNIVETINHKKLKNSNNFLINKIKKENKKIVLSVGRLEKQKNFKFLLKSFSFLKEKKIFLIIVGSGKLQNYLNSQISQNNLKNVRLIGESTDINSIYKKSDLYVQSSLYEGMPNSILEASFNNKKVLIKKYDGAFLDFKTYGIKINISNGNEKIFSEQIEGILKLNNNKKLLNFNKQKIILNNSKSKQIYKNIFTLNYIKKFNG